MKRRLSVTNLNSENSLLMFRLNAPVIIRAKVKKCETNASIYSHALLRYRYTSREVRGWWGLLLPASSSQWSSNQGLPVLQFGWIAPLKMSSGCAGPPSVTAPVSFCPCIFISIEHLLTTRQSHHTLYFAICIAHWLLQWTPKIFLMTGDMETNPGPQLSPHCCLLYFTLYKTIVGFEQYSLCNELFYKIKQTSTFLDFY